MKNLLLLSSLLSCMSLIGQSLDNNNVSVTNNTSNTMLSASNGMQSSYGSSAYFVNPSRAVDGTVYLFEDWSNSGIIYATTNEKYSLKNINLNIERNSFESKVGQDSLFSFNFNNIDKFVVNGRTFKNYYWDDDNRVYEIIYENENWSLIKGFKIVEVSGSANPMLNRTRDRIIRKAFYYLKDDSGINTFIMKKNKILKLLNKKESGSEEVLRYVKSNKLSFKREEDVVKILDYSLGQK